MQAKQRANPPSSFVEQREFERKAVDLPGDLVVPTEGCVLACQVVNLSGGGASLRCAEPPPLHTYVILCLDGLGRLGAVTKRYEAGELGLQFVLTEARRRRLLADIANRGGVAGEMRLRRDARLPSISKVRFTLPGGGELHCEVIDASRQGLSLRTDKRPAVNERLSIGRKYGRVVRHHGEGIAIEFSGTEGDPSHGS